MKLKVMICGTCCSAWLLSFSPPRKETFSRKLANLTLTLQPNWLPHEAFSSTLPILAWGTRGKAFMSYGPIFAISRSFIVPNSVIIFFLQCFTTNDLHEFEGSSASRGLNSTEFTDISPVIIYCLLPTSSQKNLVGEPCDISRKSHEQIFEAFVSNFSEGQDGISYKGLEIILKQINNTVGQFFTKKKVWDYFSQSHIFTYLTSNRIVLILSTYITCNFRTERNLSLSNPILRMK